MDNFEGHKPPDKIESHHERNIKDEIVKLEARMFISKGHKTFQYNKKTGILSIAESERIIVTREAPIAPEGSAYLTPHVDLQPKIINKIKTKENCFYFQRLNFGNAVKFVKKCGYKKIYIQKAQGGGE